MYNWKLCVFHLRAGFSVWTQPYCARTFHLSEAPLCIPMFPHVLSHRCSALVIPVWCRSHDAFRCHLFKLMELFLWGISNKAPADLTHWTFMGSGERTLIDKLTWHQFLFYTFLLVRRHLFLRRPPQANVNNLYFYGRLCKRAGCRCISGVITVRGVALIARHVY